jgi:hypothetical protein
MIILYSSYEPRRKSLLVGYGANICSSPIIAGPTHSLIPLVNTPSNIFPSSLSVVPG